MCVCDNVCVCVCDNVCVCRVWVEKVAKLEGGNVFGMVGWWVLCGELHAKPTTSINACHQCLSSTNACRAKPVTSINAKPVTSINAKPMTSINACRLSMPAHQCMQGKAKDFHQCLSNNACKANDFHPCLSSTIACRAKPTQQPWTRRDPRSPSKTWPAAMRPRCVGGWGWICGWGWG